MLCKVTTGIVVDMNTTSESGSTTPGIHLLKEGHVAHIVLDLPHSQNCFRPAQVHELRQRLDEALAQHARCIVIRGARAVFSAGWDLTSVNPATDKPSDVITHIVAPALTHLRTLPVPTIAAVAGPALGFGLGIALSCDITLAADDALFGSPFRNIGMLPDSATHYFLLHRLGYPLAAKLIYTGRLVSGTEACNMRLINRSVPGAQLLHDAQTLATQIANGPTQAFRLSKQILLQGGDFATMLAYEAEYLNTVFHTHDFHEGLRAFQERRPPAFAGR